MAKAFDRVDHALLSHVLSTIGVSGKLRWFESYLHERSVCTVAEQRNSPFARISYDGPQGSVLGALLFIIYNRNLPSLCLRAVPCLLTILSCTTTARAATTNHPAVVLGLMFLVWTRVRVNGTQPSALPNLTC